MENRIEKFLAKPKSITIAGEQILLHPLTMENIGLFVNLNDDTKKIEAFRKILYLTLKKTFPEMTEEQFNNISFEYFMDLIDGVLEVNNLKEDERLTKIKEQIATKKQ